MARKKSLTAKAKELGIDLNKTSVGNLIDKLHKSQKELTSCRGENPCSTKGDKISLLKNK